MHTAERSRPTIQWSRQPTAPFRVFLSAYTQEGDNRGATLEKTPDDISHALARGVRRKVDDERFRVDLGKLDRVIATEGTRA